jgi:hypothetical protein
MCEKCNQDQAKHREWAKRLRNATQVYGEGTIAVNSGMLQKVIAELEGGA